MSNVTFPAALWWILIPSVLAAVAAVIQQFYPTSEFFWSALFVAVVGSGLAAVAEYRRQASIQAPPPGVAAAPAPQRGFLSRWFLVVL